MVIGKNRKVLIPWTVAFLIVLMLFFAYVPRGAGRTPVTVVVKSGTSLRAIADQLKADGLIRSSYAFMLVSLFYRGQLIAGEYTLGKDMSLVDIVRKMGRGERNIYLLKIVEGFNLYNISNAIEKSGIMKGDEFLRIAKDPALLRKLGIAGNSLEGYLAPDTYYYSREVDAEAFVERIVQITFRNLTKPDLKERMETLKFDVHKTLTLASMIEREAKMKDEKPLISAVFHNRLMKGMSLDSDPTVIYGTGRFGNPIRKSDLSAYTPYNTYTFQGLPKGPICSPDRSSILAALYPAPVGFLYFVSKNDGTHAFSKDIDEHNRFVTIYQRAKKHNKTTS